VEKPLIQNLKILNFKRDAQNLLLCGNTMADKSNKASSAADKVSKSTPFNSEEKRKKAWAKAEKSITQGKPDGALVTLREVDATGSHPTTLRLAGVATYKIAQRTRSKSDYRKAASLLRDSVKMNPKDKQSNSSYNEVLNEMQDKGISESVIPRLVNDGTPTLAGVFAFGAGLLLLLASIGVLANGTSSSDLVILEMSWTNDNGLQQTGTVTIELYPDDAPMHVENFKALVSGGYYDNTIYHRIIQDFMLQGGDFQNSDGTGGHAVVWSGYCNGQAASASTDCAMTDWTLPDEADNGLIHEPYVLSMAKTNNPHTGGSQFFIVSPDSTPSHLDGVHTVFGKVIDGQNVVAQIDTVPTAAGDVPVNTVSLNSASFQETSTPWYQFW
jgi:cyclophilin family peptidyl-prolyl cis-trans isomerase